MLSEDEKKALSVRAKAFWEVEGLVERLELELMDVQRVLEQKHADENQLEKHLRTARSKLEVARLELEKTDMGDTESMVLTHESGNHKKLLTLTAVDDGVLARRSSWVRGI